MPSTLLGLAGAQPEAAELAAPHGVTMAFVLDAFPVAAAAAGTCLFSACDAGVRTRALAFPAVQTFAVAAARTRTSHLTADFAAVPVVAPAVVAAGAHAVPRAFRIDAAVLVVPVCGSDGGNIEQLEEFKALRVALQQLPCF